MNIQSIKTDFGSVVMILQLCKANLANAKDNLLLCQQNNDDIGQNVIVTYLQNMEQEIKSILETPVTSQIVAGGHGFAGENQ